jgi:hypothetical protein
LRFPWPFEVGDAWSDSIEISDFEASWEADFETVLQFDNPRTKVPEHSGRADRGHRVGMGAGKFEDGVAVHGLPGSRSFRYLRR